VSIAPVLIWDLARVPNDDPSPRKLSAPNSAQRG